MKFYFILKKNLILSASFGILHNCSFPCKSLEAALFESSQGGVLQGQDTCVTYRRSHALHQWVSAFAEEKEEVPGLPTC